ncbi:peptidase [Kordiimonas sp. SCSIO 12610]|nr:peptidase [Kordiimonas sp. SCSIO 12610]
MGLKAAAVGALLSFTSFSGLHAEELDYYLVQGTKYDQSVLKPAEVFGHDIGDQPARHDLMVEYLRRVAEQSPRMKVETIGYSHERRPILFFTISHPDNLANIDEIRENHLKRVNPETAGEASDDLPVVTWINYGVHGAEASGMEAAIPTVYHLAAAEGEDIETTLKNSVIVMVAVFNPDGHSRRISWVSRYGSNVVATDPAHEIHNEAWPGGRTNHYWFDLNRQWLLQTQPESQAWLTAWHKWKPEVSADFHEMGRESTYYFHPGVPTRKYPLIPNKGRELLVEIGDYHARFLDSEAKLYFTEEGFDNYYIGKGSTYPQVNGGLGILFEAGAQAGIAWESRQGLKTYANNIRIHFRTSLTTIEGAAAMRTRLHGYQREFFESALELAKDDPVKAYVFRAPEDPVRVNMFLDLLQRHHIIVNKVKGTIKADGKNFGSDSYIISLNQAQYRMAKGLMNRITEFPDKVFYDVSGWTMPLAYGLDYAEVRGSLRGKIGEIALPETVKVSVPDEAPYAYVFRWSDYYAPRALNHLLQAGVLARVATEPMELLTTKGQVSLDRGAIIVPLERQTLSLDSIHRMMEQLAFDNQITVHSAISGRTVNPGVELGGRNSVRDLKAPKPLLVTGTGVSPYDAGEVWHLFDKRMHMPLTLVRKERLGRVNLNEYTHLILVGGNGSNVPKSMTKKVQDWVRAGGTLVAHRHGAQWAIKNILSTASASEKKTVGKSKVERLPYSGKGQDDARHVIGGAVFGSELDITHPLGFGFTRSLVATNRNTSFKLPVPKDPYAQVAVYQDNPLMSGYASDRRLQELKGTPMLTAERMGQGSVILFADDPNFRATYVGAEKLFLNSIFFSGVFDRANLSGEADEDAHAE